MGSLGYLKCVIYPERALIFDADLDAVQDFSSDLIHEMAFAQDTNIGFALTVLERMLVLLCDMYERRIRLMGPLAGSVLAPSDASRC